MTLWANGLDTKIQTWIKEHDWDRKAKLDEGGAGIESAGNMLFTTDQR